MLQAGQRLDDYRISSFVAGGGMGEIYLAEEISLGRKVAIKVIRPEAVRYPDSEDARKLTQLFQREATAIARLNHPYILPLYRFGQAAIDGNPLMYMVMPYCEEKLLTDWMYAHGNTVLSAQEVGHILRQAAEALQYAHNQGIIHLDVKPSNLLVRYHSNDVGGLNLQLTDFGVAKFSATTGMSQTVRGSLEYMAPEYWEGHPVFATDQYALTVMVYKLLTGQPPFKGSGFEQFWHQHRYSSPPPPSTINHNISPAIDAVMVRALAKEPGARYPSIQAFADAYQQAIQPQLDKTEYIPIYQTLMLSPEEASRGTTRTITLPSGEQLPVTVSPGAYQGQVIHIRRQNAPSVLITIQIPIVQTPQSSPKPNRTWIFVLAALALVLIIGGLVIGVFAYNHQQFNNQSTATASANQATQDAISAQQTQDAVNAQQTQDAQATQSAQPSFPNIQGTYTGSFQSTSASSSSQMTLDIVQQNQQDFGGTCTLGSTNFTIHNGTVDTSGNIQFSIDATDSNGNNVTVTFTGTAQSSGGWQGSFSDTGGGQGTWSAS